MKAERRLAPRREINPLRVASMSSMENLAKIARGGIIIDASTTGFLIQVQRDQLVPRALRENLNIDPLIGTKVILYLPQMNLELTGEVARTRFIGKKGYEIAIDFSHDAPEFWRECLLDLLPLPGELEESDDAADE